MIFLVHLIIVIATLPDFSLSLLYQSCPSYSPVCPGDTVVFTCTTNTGIVSWADNSDGTGIMKLSLGNVYNFSVAGVDKRETIGLFSESIIIDLSVPDQIMNFQYRINYIGSNNVNIVIYWNPQADLSHPPVLYYIVTNPLTNTIINTTNTSVIITGLTPGHNYNINITAVNIIGPGPVLKRNVTIQPSVTSSSGVKPTTTVVPSVSATDRSSSVLNDGAIAGIIISIVILVVLIIIVILTIVVILIYKVSSTEQRRGETSPVIKEFFSVKNEAYGITKGPDHKSSIDVTENVAYSTLEQQSSLINPPVYETINENNSKTTGVYDNINDYM